MLVSTVGGNMACLIAFLSFVYWFANAAQNFYSFLN